MSNTNSIVSSSTKVAANVEIWFAHLAKPITTPFGVEQYELQVRTDDKTLAKQLVADGARRVKNSDGTWGYNLKRRSVNANGDNVSLSCRIRDAETGAPREMTKSELEGLGNGSKGAITYFNYKAPNGKTVMCLSGIAIKELVVFTPKSTDQQLDELL